MSLAATRALKLVCDFRSPETLTAHEYERDKKILQALLFTSSDKKNK